jgi:molybdenum cofactor biosynthesis protein B
MKLAILTVSDSRTRDNDTSGDVLEQRARGAGHSIAARQLVRDDRYLLRAVLSQWIVDPNIEAVLVTGGTGVTARDVTVEALRPLLDKEIEGFGEIFRWLSYQQVGSSTVQSRAFGGVANATLIFCVPGSTRACELAWDEVLGPQLDAGNKPCNFAELLPRLG